MPQPNRVGVVTADGRHCFSVSAERAQIMLRTGEAHSPVRRHKKLVMVQPTHLAPRTHDGRPQGGNLCGTRYTHMEEGTRHEFNRIHPEDAPLFRLSVTDCLTENLCQTPRP